ncbi:response regulator receiver modulated CheB methylesterase [Rippkaea orientalis PCC 8801]|uniref:Protein-glutamate methylesterase/protein-glutamine glutaminase n=1 Tax=Rippkaea orientalis (strain PCC 8801 / RF-1) TaxID=41431 RepID=B7JYH7_RIPO1|nr:chemotaxis-specific protein-glutamate methyltransferase CheB [Rippkaea orientalis]ACK64847.1 response regulator receiver modulated CheB methylesterase [Rippkaea orientalis PCC 8801]
MIKVLLVEDSPVALTLLKRMLTSNDQTEVVGTARTGIEALELIPKVNPDVICTDIYMPQMDGLEFTSQVMAKYPRPILVISAGVQNKDTQEVFAILDAGAVDVFPKPAGGLGVDYEVTKKQLINKIKVLSGIKVFTKIRRTTASIMLTKSSISTPETRLSSVVSSSDPDKIRVVAIAASTGGPHAFQEIFSSLTPNFPVPILCVQHISEGFLQGFLNWLKTVCSLRVEIAEHQQVPQPGKIYFPPEHRHLQIDAQGRFNCTLSPPVDGHCPSATALFESVAQFYGKESVGILLTGMGRDGARGLLKIAQAGGLTIAQDESTSVVFGMPQEAIKLGATKTVLPIQEIAPLLINKLMINTKVIAKKPGN